MKKIFLLVSYGFLLLTVFYVSATASDFKITGSAYFKCDFLSKYMVKHGYFLIREDVTEKNSKTNLYAASNAELIIKNRNNTVIGKGKTDNKGDFSVNVPEEHSYIIIFRFNGHEIEKSVPYTEANNFKAELGYFSTDKVGDWIDARLGLR